MYRSSLLTAVSVVVLLGACSNTDLIEQTERTKPTGSAFSQNIYAEYLGLAKSEEAQGDRGSARHYLTKAGLAAKGKEVGPDDPRLRNIAGPEENAIVTGRSKLDAALKAGAGARKPAEAAKAQAMLDCWMEQTEEGFQPGDISACRIGFETALAALGDTVTAADKALPPSGSPFTVNFNFDSVKLTEKSEAELRRILEKADVYKVKTITITAYTDLAGKAGYNDALSARRAAALEDRFKEAGVETITATGKGATDPIEQTGRPNLTNRRAVIQFH